jgi:DNA-binding CsgD family transcriptional regulator
LQRPVIVRELLGRLPTRAEQRALEQLARDLTFKEVADELHGSIHTVKSPARRLYRRLGVNSQQAAVEAACERGLLGERPVEEKADPKGSTLTVWRGPAPGGTAPGSRPAPSRS